MLAGVALALSEQWRINVGILRALFVVAAMVSPIVLLVYLFLALSIPTERAVVSLLSFMPDDDVSGFARFSMFTSILLHRVRGRAPSSRRRAVAFALLMLTLLLELPRIGGQTDYQLHPIAEALGMLVSRYSSVVFYLLAAVVAIASFPRAKNRIILQQERAEELRLTSGPQRTLSGLAGGLSRITGIDAAWLRAGLLWLNFLTVGIAGAIYLVTAYALRRAGRLQADDDLPVGEREDATAPSSFRLQAGALLVILAAIRLSTELRLFFFNEPFVRGLVLVALGMLFSRRAFTLSMGRSIMLLAGAAIAFRGFYDLSIGSFHVQLSFGERWEVAYVIATLAVVYYALVALRGYALRVAMAIAGMGLLAVLLIATGITSERFLLALTSFYAFFFPLLFAALGLWVAMEE